MLKLKENVKKALLTAVQSSYEGDLVLAEMVASSLSLSTNEKFGHYQSNLAMRASKKLKQNPREIASNIVDKIDHKSVAKVEIAGPGFINFWINDKAVSQYCSYQLTDSLGVEKNNNANKIIIDYSSPNIAKEMQVWHLRSTIIGDAIANALELLGNEVLRINHVGDWGTAFGMLICYLQDNHPQVLDGNQETNLTELVGWYKQAKAKFDDDADFKKRSQLQVVALQGGDPAARRSWKVICDVSRNGFNQIYSMLDVNLIERGESFYNDALPGIIEDLEKQGLLTESDGAKCVYLDNFKNRDNQPLPLIAQKSDGGFNYSTTDLAALKYRYQTEHADRIIYITDAGQSLHFQMVFETAKLAKFIDVDKVSAEHASFGLVLNDKGKKFRTRSGESIRLQDLLDEAVSRARAILQERNAGWSEDEINNAAMVLGIAAIKYADLSNNRTSDYKFSFDRMLQFEGNTAAFILYSYVRTKSIIRKTGVSIADINVDNLNLQHPSEISLGFHLARFSDVIEKLAEDLTPHYLTDYLFETAQRFNAFFRDCRVEGVAEQASRLLLCELTGQIIKTGLSVLGIKAVSRM